MDLAYVFNHIGYVVCFWGVWKGLDVLWRLLYVDSLIDSLLGRKGELERTVERATAGKLQFYNGIREKDEKATRKLISDLQAAFVALQKKIDTTLLDASVRQAVFDLCQNINKATEGIKFDAELTKEVERLRKKMHELLKVVDEPTPCVLPVNPDAEPEPVEEPKKKTSKKAPAKRGKNQAEPLRYGPTSKGGQPFQQFMLNKIREESLGAQPTAVSLKQKLAMAREAVKKS